MVLKSENCDSHDFPPRVLCHPADSRSIDEEGRFDRPFTQNTVELFSKQTCVDWLSISPVKP
jgi:hypothetical protein